MFMYVQLQQYMMSESLSKCVNNMITPKLFLCVPPPLTKLKLSFEWSSFDFLFVFVLNNRIWKSVIGHFSPDFC